MKRVYNIGTECYALMISTNDPEFLIPLKIMILEKYSTRNKMFYKVKIREILENNFNYVKEHLPGIMVVSNIKTDGKSTLIKKGEIDKMNGMGELLTKLNDKHFYIESNYITLDKEGLKDLYNRFTKYIINYHFRKLFQLMSNTFLAGTPIFENQKDMFKKRVEKIGFGDMFEKYKLKLSI